MEFTLFGPNNKAAQSHAPVAPVRPHQNRVEEMIKQVNQIKSNFRLSNKVWADPFSLTKVTVYLSLLLSNLGDSLMTHEDQLLGLLDDIIAEDLLHLKKRNEEISIDMKNEIEPELNATITEQQPKSLDKLAFQRLLRCYAIQIELGRRRNDQSQPKVEIRAVKLNALIESRIKDYALQSLKFPALQHMTMD